MLQDVSSRVKPSHSLKPVTSRFSQFPSTPISSHQMAAFCNLYLDLQTPDVLETIATTRSCHRNLKRNLFKPCGCYNFWCPPSCRVSHLKISASKYFFFDSAVTFQPLDIQIPRYLNRSDTHIFLSIMCMAGFLNRGSLYLA